MRDMHQQYNQLGLPQQHPFTTTQVLLYYDGPRLFWLHDGLETYALVEAAAETPETYLELLVYVDPQRKIAIDKGEISLREAYTKASPGQVYLITHPTRGFNAVTITPQNPTTLPERWLPEDGVKLGAKRNR